MVNPDQPDNIVYGNFSTLVVKPIEPESHASAHPSRVNKCNLSSFKCHLGISNRLRVEYIVGFTAIAVNINLIFLLLSMRGNVIKCYSNLSHKKMS